MSDHSVAFDTRNWLHIALCYLSLLPSLYVFSLFALLEIPAYLDIVTFNAPYTSFYPIDSEDSSLSFIHSSRIPAPGLASDFLTHICSRERIHHSRAQLFTTSRARATSVYSSSLSAHERKIQALPDDPAYTLAPPVEPLRLVPGGCGTSRANPIVLYLDLDPSMDRTTAAHPINGLERAGRRFAKAVQKVVGVVVTGLTICFGTLQKVPKGMEWWTGFFVRRHVGGEKGKGRCEAGWLFEHRWVNLWTIHYFFLLSFWAPYRSSWFPSRYRVFLIIDFHHSITFHIYSIFSHIYSHDSLWTCNTILLSSSIFHIWCAHIYYLPILISPNLVYVNHPVLKV